VSCDSSNDDLVDSFSFTIAHVDPDIAGKRVGKINSQQFSWHWPGDDELILPIVTSIINMTILSIVNTAIANLPDTSWKIRQLSGCLDNPNEDGGPYTRDVTPIVDNNTAAGWVKPDMKLWNPTHFCIVHHGQQANSTDGAQAPMLGGHSYHLPDDILVPPAKDMIDNIGEESDGDGKTRHPNPRSLPTTKPGFQMFEWKL
jgi:hypothetical protein